MASAFTRQDLQADLYRWRSEGKGTMVQIFYETADKRTIIEKSNQSGNLRDVDAVYIKNFFEENKTRFPGGVDVKWRRIKSLTETNTIIKKECNEKYDCFLFVFLTFLQADGTLQFNVNDQHGVSLEEVVKVVRELEVAHGKPKVFLIQSDDMSLIQEKETEKGGTGPQPERKVIKIPSDADRLIIQSTIPQDVAKKDSFMIQAFVDVIAENLKRGPAQRKDLLSLTIDLNSSVKNKVTSLKHPQVRKDDLPVPLVTSTLTKLLNLHK